MIYFTLLSLDSFQQDALSNHNQYRSIHAAPPLTLNKEMSESARKYAEYLLLQGTLTHSSKQERSGQGENLNLACTIPDAPSPNEATRNWYVLVPSISFTYHRRIQALIALTTIWLAGWLVGWLVDWFVR